MPDRLIRWATHGRASPGPKQVFVFTLGLYTALRGLILMGMDTLRPGLGFITDVLPLHWWGWAWLAVGLYAIGGAVTRHYVIPLIPIAVMSALWATSYTVSWGAQGFAGLGWYAAAGYLVQAVACLVVVRLIDPPEVGLTGGGEDD
ncbi:hypothetical protein DFO66_103398 [Brevibacterium sanguinis]|uniref:Uncharacterized protein n=2 Tax=Brevibacterium TaxID=1696 RepID=A0A366IN35_9MICO|nr:MULTISPECIES: hypothetical protein [Brevibacterium]RBP66448.1 hypothetical protein DFO66_103398 [Brevibacterium sanguinis]RBP73100.1 hypothetical protein DFO65_103398 [Brevibacterium celere]